MLGVRGQRKASDPLSMRDLSPLVSAVTTSQLPDADRVVAIGENLFEGDEVERAAIVVMRGNCCALQCHQLK